MSPVTPNDFFNLDEDEETTSKNDDLTLHYFNEILGGETKIQIVFECEGCGGTLRTPMVVLISAPDDGDDDRDSSILCDEKCAN